MFELQKIIDKKVEEIRGFKPIKQNKKEVQARYILFSDKETILELSEQDGYTYHDCNLSAREITVRKNSNLWKQIKDNTINYPIATFD